MVLIHYQRLCLDIELNEITRAPCAQDQRLE